MRLADASGMPKARLHARLRCHSHHNLLQSHWFYCKQLGAATWSPISWPWNEVGSGLIPSPWRLVKVFSLFVTKVAVCVVVGLGNVWVGYEKNDDSGLAGNDLRMPDGVP